MSLIISTRVLRWVSNSQMTHLKTLISANMNLNVIKRTVFLEPLESVPGVTMLLMVAVRSPTVWEQNQNLVNRLRVLGKIILPVWMSDYSYDENNSNNTQNMSGSFKWVWGFLFWVWMKWGNLAGSRMKKTGVLLKTQSKLPSSVFNLIANPRGSRAVSAEPFSPPTVENRTVAGTFLPTVLKSDWEVTSLMSWVTSK